MALYRQQVITAWREVNDAAISVRKLGEVAAQEEIQVTAATTAERLARLRYDGGVSNYLEVLDAQRSLFNSELTLAQTNRDQLVALVQLYKALGGGWQEKVPRDPAAKPVPAGTPGPHHPAHASRGACEGLGLQEADRAGGDVRHRAHELQHALGRPWPAPPAWS